MSVFKPPIGATSVGDATTLNGKTESELSVYDSERLGGTEADDYTPLSVLNIPTQSSKKQVMYRNVEEEKISNGAFPTNLTGWTLTAFGGVTTYDMYADSDNYHIAVNGCLIFYDIPEDDPGATTRGVKFTQTGVDLTGVSQLTFYAKQMSSSVSYNDIQLFLYEPIEDGIDVTGRTGGDSGFVDDSWRLCSIDIPSDNRLPNQTVTIGFTYSGISAKPGLEVVIDEVSAMGTPANVFEYIKDIDEYIGEQVDVHLDIPYPEEYKQIMYRTTKVNGISSGDMERSSASPWYGPDLGETLSMDSSIYHSGSKSLKSTFDLGSGSSTYLMLDDIDLTGVDEITFWIYGGANCANGTVGASLGEMPSAQSFSTGSWTQITYEVPSGNKTTGQNLSLEITCTANTGIAIYLDDVVALVNPSDTYGWMSLPVSWAGALASDPSTPDNGTMYWNTTSSTLKIYVNSVVGWKTITTT